MAGWNYRILKEVGPDGEDPFYSIVEAYYKPFGWTRADLGSDTAAGVKEVLDMVRTALTKPVIDDQGNEIEPAPKAQN